MIKSKKLVSVVVPMYFEEEVAYECYHRLTDVMSKGDTDYELIFVNDGSTDKTLPILKGIALNDKKVKVISFSRNFGHQNAVTAGVFGASGDAIVIIDADLQDPPELIPDMIAKWQEGYDVVYAKRKQRKGESIFKLVTAKYFYKFLHAMSDVEIPKDTGDFRLIDRKVAEVFKKEAQFKDGHHLFVQLHCLAEYSYCLWELLGSILQEYMMKVNKDHYILLTKR